MEVFYAEQDEIWNDEPESPDEASGSDEMSEPDEADEPDEPDEVDDPDEADACGGESMSRDEKIDLLCEHCEFVTKLTRAIGIDRDSVDDVANESMASAYIGIDGLREPEKIKSWLRTIVKNEAKAYYAEESKQRQIRAALQEEAAAKGLVRFSEFVAGEIAFREMMQRADDKEFADEIMDRLPPVQRSIMYMRFWGGYPFKEVGEILGIKPSTARCMYTRCRQRLCIRYANVNREEADRVDIRKKYAYLYDDE